MDAITTTPRARILKRWQSMKDDRQSWFDHWRELMEYVKPRRGRFLAVTSTKTSDGGKKNDKIINGTAGMAARVLASGMMAGITSPARPWFRLTAPDPELADYGSVRSWMHVVEERIREAFARSNLYNCLHQFYEDLATPGTACLHVEEDQEDLVRGYVFPIGQYCLANDARLRVNTVYRQTGLTVQQLVEKFGEAKCSQQVKDLYARKELDQWVDVLHVLEPNRDYEPGRLGPKGKPWRSCWLEASGPDSGPQYLGEGGYEEFPAMVARWEVNGEDVYGSSPGMMALGDVKALQLYEKHKARAVENIINPPMTGPSSMQNQRVSMLPGTFTYSDAMSPAQQFRPSLEVRPEAVNVVELSIREHEQRIKQAFYADLWLALMEQDGQMTAREVAERHEEKMLQLGPVMERLQDELLDPLIDRVFGILHRGGHIPPPPQELQGVQLRVEYISIMAAAQKLLGTTAVERLASFVGNVAAVQPEILDKLDTDKVVDEYAGMLGTKPDLLRTDEAVQALRAERAKARQQAAAQEQAAQAVQGAQTLSKTDMQGDTALNRLLGSAGVPPGLKQ